MRFSHSIEQWELCGPWCFITKSYSDRHSSLETQLLPPFFAEGKEATTTTTAGHLFLWIYFAPLGVIYFCCFLVHFSIKVTAIIQDCYYSIWTSPPQARCLHALYMLAFHLFIFEKVGLIPLFISVHYFFQIRCSFCHPPTFPRFRGTNHNTMECVKRVVRPLVGLPLPH